MNREDYIWVGIRLFGIWLAVLWLGASLSTAGAALQLYAADASANADLQVSGRLARGLLLDSRANVAIGALKMLAYGAAAWYMLRRGEGLVAWVAPPRA